MLLGLCVPLMVWLVVFNYIPMVGVIIAFKNYNNRLGMFGSPWVGMKNFEYLFKSQDFFRIVRNTIGYNIIFIITGVIFAVFVAILLNSLKRKISVKIFQTGYFLPFFISWVIVAFIVQLLLDVDKGILNSMITTFGGEPVFWYQEKYPWPFIFTIANLWKNFGYSTIMYYGAIMNIDQELYEAAKIDGCTEGQLTRYITIPLLMPMAVMLTILSVSGIMRGDFSLFYYVSNDSGMIYEVTDIIDTYLFRALRKTGDMGTSSAVGLFQSVAGFVLVMISNKIAHKVDENTALI